jgi:hypothetical protein
MIRGGLVAVWVGIAATASCFGTPRTTLPDGDTSNARCGDGKVNGSEVCDNGGAGTTSLGECNPECSGYFQKKLIYETVGFHSGKLGGPSGADSICQAEFGSRWKALIVGGGRRATLTPNTGDGQVDWVVQKYTHYYNGRDEFTWRTDGSALLGVSDKQRLNLYADAFFELVFYPWGGYDDGWVEVARNLEPGLQSGTCLGWSSDVGSEPGTFALSDLRMGRQEPCSGTQPLLCVEQ